MSSEQTDTNTVKDAGGDEAVLAQASSNAVHEMQEELSTLYSWGGDPRSQEPTQAGSCVGPFLVLLGWRGDARHLEEAKPHHDVVHDLDDVRAVLDLLGYATRTKKMRTGDLSENTLPCIFIDHKKRHFVICSTAIGGKFFVFNGETRSFETRSLSNEKGVFLFAQPKSTAVAEAEITTFGWFSFVLRHFTKLIAKIMALSFVSNALTIIVSLYVMVVYDNIVRSRSLDTLAYLAGGVVALLLFDVLLRRMRSRGLAYLGSRIDAVVGIAVFQQLLNLPVQMTESAPIGTQLTRIKQFEHIRDVFTGPIAVTIMDLPFVSMFLLAVWMIGGALIWIPVTLTIVYVILGIITIPMTNRHVKRAGDVRARLQAYLIELVSKQRAIKEAMAEDVWNERFQTLARDSVLRQFHARQFNRTVQGVAQAIATMAGVLTLLAGAMMVMNETLSIGALIATMVFIWRILAPIQTAFTSLNRYGQLRQSIRQLDALMRLRVERRGSDGRTVFRRLNGDIQIDRLSFRYGRRPDPALSAVSLRVHKGELVAVTGPSGSGKSTLLKMIAGLYEPQAGVVRIDGLDIRQLDVGELRSGIAIVPQNSNVFYGTVLQNFHLAAPGVSRKVIEEAIKDADLESLVGSMSDGLDTRLTKEVLEALPDGFEQRLNLARAYAKQSALLLLDVPAQGLDNKGDRALMAKLRALKGKTTVLMVTHRPDHMRLADRLVVLDSGMIVANGPPDKVLQALKGAA